MKNAQSSAIWFQPAAIESARPPGTSVTPSTTPSSPSEGAIAHLELRRLAEARSPGTDPVGDPVEHHAERHAGVAEQLRRLRRVGEQRGGRLGPHDLRRLAEP